MRILVLGGTGSIGGAVLKELLARKFTVFALARSPSARDSLRKTGAITIEGDIRYPDVWSDCLQDVDAVIHAAATWHADMDVVDQALVAALLDGLKTTDSSKSLIYTGGCWLYGGTGDTPAIETTPLSPSINFASAIDTMKMVLTDSRVRGMVIHPAMVYERGGGVFDYMYEDIEKLGFVRVFGGLNVRWPLVHKADLARLYSLLLINGQAGDIYNGCAMDGIRIGDIALALVKSCECGADPVVVNVKQAQKEFGDWAEGYALDQLMSGQKARTELGWLPEHLDVFKDIY